ncbi:MAG: hypothetical protein J7K38_01190 [Thermoplasmata archaeon]|nr:hypothetical protein [Thermoplasmata archaeon]
MNLSKNSAVIVILCMVLVIIICIPTNSFIPFLRVEHVSDNKTMSPAEEDVYKTVDEKEDFVIIDGIEKIEGEPQIDIMKIDDSSFLFTQCTHPKVVNHGKEVLAICRYIGSYQDLYLRYSLDYGKRWSDILVLRGSKELGYDFSVSNQSKPSLSIGSQGYAMAVFCSQDVSSGFYMLEFQDIGDPSMWTLSYVDLSSVQKGSFRYRIENIHDMSIDISRNNEVLIAGVGDVVNISSNHITHDTPIILFSNNGGKDFELIFSEDTPYQNIGLEKTSVSIDRDAYVCYEIRGNGILCLYFPDKNFMDGWEDFSVESTDLTVYKNPHVYTWNDHAIIILESITKDNSDIGFFLTTDSGSSWAPGVVDVASSDYDERMPALCIRDKKFVLSFERGYSVYVTESTDLETWTEPKKVNSAGGDIYPYYGFSDFGNDYGIVWGEIYKGQPVIRFYGGSADIRKGLPDILIVENSVNLCNNNSLILKKTNNILSFEIENAGSADAGDFIIEIYMKRKNENESTPVAFKEIYGLKSGERVRVNITLFDTKLKDMVKALIFFVRVDSLIIKMDPPDEVHEDNESNNELELKVNYSSIFPRFSWLENTINNLLNGNKEEEYQNVEQLITQVLSEYLSE